MAPQRQLIVTVRKFLKSLRAGECTALQHSRGQGQDTLLVFEHVTNPPVPLRLNRNQYFPLWQFVRVFQIRLRAEGDPPESKGTLFWRVKCSVESTCYVAVSLNHFQHTFGKAGFSLMLVAWIHGFDQSTMSSTSGSSLSHYMRLSSKKK